MINSLKKFRFVGKNKLKSVLKLVAFIIFTKAGSEVIIRIFKKTFRRYLNPDSLTYSKWILTKLDPKILREDYDAVFPTLKIKPKISIIMPVYNPPVKYLKLAIESVLTQLYDNFELCIADDKSTNASVVNLLKDYAKKDNRIKLLFREVNGHIAACSNSALSIADGDFVLFLDHDDLLTQNCLFEVVKHLNVHPQDEIIYSDDDKVDDNEVFDNPHYKADWAPDNLLSRNYFGHVVVMKKALVDNIGGFREGYEGSQDYDIILRAVEKSNHIGHIPKVLYHWRIHSGSVAMTTDAKPYAYIAAKKAINEAIIRRGNPGIVEDVPGILGTYRIKYDIVEIKKVSIIIPSKDLAKYLQTTIDSILNLTDYPDYEIIVINNNSVTEEFFQLMKNYTEGHQNIKMIDANIPFNFSKLMNIGVAACSGEYILFLNNDVKVLKADWLTTMVSFAQRKFTGMVGVKLLYPDDTIQHAGVVLGLGGPAGHVFVHAYKDENGYYSYIRALNNYSSVTLACAMCRKEVFLEVGGMDENIPVEYNDIDLCVRIYKKGYFNVYVPDVELYHYESISRGHPLQSKEAWAVHERDLKIFMDKWGEFTKNDPFYNPNLSLNYGFGLEFK